MNKHKRKGAGNKKKKIRADNRRKKKISKYSESQERETTIPASEEKIQRERCEKH